MNSKFEVPPKLNKGDKVAIMAPSSGGAKEYPHVYEKGLEVIKDKFGLEPVEYPSASKGNEYLYNHPKERAQELMSAFEDDSINGVISTIGGDDQLRILKYLEPKRLKENPTRFYGLSDNTNVALYLWNQGVVSYYGGMVLTSFGMQNGIDEFTEKYLKKSLFEKNIGKIEASNRFTDDASDWKKPESLEKAREWDKNPGWEFYNLENKKIEGRIWGGCLEIVDWWMKTDKYIPEQKELKGKVLALETSEELPDSTYINRFFMCMGERGLLDEFTGIIMGRPKTRNYKTEKTEKEREKFRKEQREVIKEKMDEYAPETPVVFNLDFGHTSPKIPIPIGGKIEINTKEEKIYFE